MLIVTGVVGCWSRSIDMFLHWSRHGTYNFYHQQSFQAIKSLTSLLIAAFYTTGVDDYSNTEDYWEGSFAIFASLVISILGAGLLRVSKMKEKWAVKLSKAMESKKEHHLTRKGALKLWCEKYVMFLLPFVTVLREGLEAIVFVAGVTFSSPASSVPLPVVIGLIAGAAVGYLLYK